MIGLKPILSAVLERSGRWMRSGPLRVLAILGVLVSTSALVVSSGTTGDGEIGRTRPAKPILESVDKVPGQYIITFGPREADGPSLTGQFTGQGVKAAIAYRDFVESSLEDLGAQVRFRYQETGVGFSAELPPAALAKARALEEASEGFMRLEPNRIMTLFRARPAEGVDRIDQLTPPPDGSYHPLGDGGGVRVYVIDSGIRASHKQFEGRVLAGEGFAGVNDGYGTGDCEGHGTHVAGIIGGSIHGVARKVTLHPVRVFGCSGRTLTDVVKAGVEWVTVHHRNNPGPAVANMSLGGAHSDALEDAILKSMKTKITYVFAAGNNYAADSCKISPAGLRAAITVASIDPYNDYRPATSNTGLCVDIFAAGENIWSTDCIRDNALVRRSGTSMAAPHVSGIAAIVLQTSRNAEPYQVWDSIKAAANTGTPEREVVHNRGDSPDVLLFWGDRRAHNLRATRIRTVSTVQDDMAEDPALVAWVNERCARP